ncbi:hypothetical protein [Asaia astilbis]|uniref:hypothetical protein n=1 Tax=Asaia astilbis TaxID=610244 RepID=UPI00046FBAA7|nr:hypothetical protein [Asaia astilbis]
MTEAMRSWQARILIDGEGKDGLYLSGFFLESTRYERCDTARIQVVVQDKAVLASEIEGRTGFDRPDVILQVRLSQSSADSWTIVFRGVLDAVTRGAEPSLFVLECRDYLAFLLDTRLASSWSNQTALELVQKAVEHAGLQFESGGAPFDAEASRYCGQFWQLEHRRLATTTRHRYQTAFDIAFSLARDHGYECHASGKSICIHEPHAVGEGNTRVFTPHGVSLQSFRHDLGLAENVVVGVQSWDSRQRARSEIFYDGQDFSTRPPGAGAALYTFRVPGQRLDDIRRLAKGKYCRIVSHASEVTLSLPAMLGLAPRHFMKVDEVLPGGRTVFSVDAVRHSFDLAHGYRQEVTLRDRVF